MLTFKPGLAEDVNVSSPRAGVQADPVGAAALMIRGYLGLRARGEMAAMLDGPPEFTDLVVVSDLVV